MTSTEFKRWLEKQGCSFEPGRGDHLLVRVGGPKAPLPLFTMFTGCMAVREAIPQPGILRRGQPFVEIPPIEEAKLRTCTAMRGAGIGKAKLARRLNWHLPQVDRLLDLNDNSRLDQPEAAFRVLGKHLTIHVVDAA